MVDPILDFLDRQKKSNIGRDFYHLKPSFGKGGFHANGNGCGQ
jgi:hypothetical protein